MHRSARSFALRRANCYDRTSSSSGKSGKRDEKLIPTLFMFAVLAQNNVEPEKKRKLANKVQQKSKLIKSAPFLSY